MLKLSKTELRSVRAGVSLVDWGKPAATRPGSTPLAVLLVGLIARILRYFGINLGGLGGGSTQPPTTTPATRNP